MQQMQELALCIFRTIARLVFLTGLLVTVGEAAYAQDQSAATPADAIVARKTLMDSIDEHMSAIEER
jgi:hypothetical protein